MQHARLAGMGLVTPLGLGVAATVDGLAAGHTGLGPLELLPPELREPVPVTEVRSLPEARTDRTQALAATALREALDDAGLAPGDEALARCPLFVGTISSRILEYELEHRAETDPERKARILAGPTYGRVGRELARGLGLGGPVATISTACTSSVNALHAAMLALRRPGVERALVVGVDPLNTVTLAGFGALLLLDPDGCRPFDARRAGIQVGEGAAAVLIERDDGSRRDRPRVGLPVSLVEPHHPTASAPDGRAGVTVMAAALRAAGLQPGDVAAIKAHGTGSRDNDLGEGLAMRELFGGAPPPFTSLKRAFGHTMGASGLLELVAGLGCAKAGFLPATAGFEEPDPDIGLSPVTQARDLDPHAPQLFNTFGFGGSLVSLVARWPA